MDIRPTMRVAIKTRVGGLNKTNMLGFPHSYEPEKSYEGGSVWSWLLKTAAGSAAIWLKKNLHIYGYCGCDY